MRCGVCGGIAYVDHTPCCTAHLARFGLERTALCCDCYCRTHFVETGCGHDKPMVLLEP